MKSYHEKVEKVLAMLAAAAITAGHWQAARAADGNLRLSMVRPQQVRIPRQQHKGGHVTDLAKLAALQACDPHKVNDPMSNELLTAVFDGLYTLDENGALDPLMAESYEVSEDG